MACLPALPSCASSQCHWLFFLLSNQTSHHWKLLLRDLKKKKKKPLCSFLTEHPKGWGTTGLSYSSAWEINLIKQSPPELPCWVRVLHSATASESPLSNSWCCSVCCLQPQANDQLWNWQSGSLGTRQWGKGKEKGRKKRGKLKINE